MIKRWPLIVLILVIIYVFIAASAFFMTSLRTGAAEQRIDSFSRDLSDEHQLYVAKKLMLEIDINSLFTTSHDINSYVKTIEWQRYLNPQVETPSIERDLLLKSLALRPTWSPTYVELYHLAVGQRQYSEAKKFLTLAQKFGPQRIETQLALVDFTFSYWSDVEVSSKIEASNTLLVLARRWKYRTELENMIRYSQGRHKMCNLLLFNRVELKACLP